MKIRQAIEYDLSALLEIYNEVVKTSAVTFDLNAKTLENMRIWFNQFNSQYPIIVAEEEGQVIGYACLTQFRPKPAYRHTVESSIYLSSRVRGNGVGSVLLNELLSLARNLNHHSVIAVIANDEEPSRKLHTKYGYKKTGTIYEAGYKFNCWHDIHFYQLKLNQS